MLQQRAVRFALLAAAAAAHPMPPVNSLPLQHNFFGLYTISLALGSPPQPVRVLLDTWSSDLWVNTPQSLGNASARHTPFDPARSSSFRDAGRSPLRLEYDHAPGGIGMPSVDVAVGSDEADFPDGRATRKAGDADPPLARLPVMLGAAQREDSFFLENGAFDGMIGFALDAAAKVESGVGVLSRLANDTGRPGVFGLYLNSSVERGAVGGLAVGGVDRTKFFNEKDEPAFVAVLPSDQPDNAGAFDLWRISIPHLQLSVNRGPGGDEGASPAEGPGAPAHPGQAAAQAAADFCGDGSGEPVGGGPMCSAVLDASGGTISLPSLLFLDIVAAVNASARGNCTHGNASSTGPSSFSWTNFVSCPASDIARMPNLTFTVGSGGPSPQASPSPAAAGAAAMPVGVYFSLVMQAGDYCVASWPESDEGGRCRLLFSTLAAPAPAPWRGTSAKRAAAAAAGPVLLLGTPFLRSFYTVFDSSEMSVGFVALRGGTVRQSQWRPRRPVPPAPPAPAASSWIGSREMWATVAGVSMAMVVAGGLFILFRERCQRAASVLSGRARGLGSSAFDDDDGATYGLDEGGSLLIEREDRAEEDFDSDDPVVEAAATSPSSPLAVATVYVPPAGDAASSESAATTPTTPAASRRVRNGSGSPAASTGLQLSYGAQSGGPRNVTLFDLQ